MVDGFISYMTLKGLFFPALTSKNLLTATVKGLLARSYQTQVTELYLSFFCSEGGCNRLCVIRNFIQGQTVL